MTPYYLRKMPIEKSDSKIRDSCFLDYNKIRYILTQLTNFSFLLYFSIDATAESGNLGRLVNHSRNGNLMTKTVFYRNRPHLVLLAKEDIEPGEELTYDYGDRSKESLLHHPWLAL